jgi:hypothetical protein
MYHTINPSPLNCQELDLNPNGTINDGSYNSWKLNLAFSASPVPEPTTFSLALLGGAAIAFFRNRRSGRRW